MSPIEREIARSMENAAYVSRALDMLWGRSDPGMRIDPIRSDLIAANLPITPEGDCIIEEEND